MANYIIINGFIKKIYKQLFLKKLRMKVILREDQLYVVGYIEVQKDQ